MALNPLYELSMRFWIVRLAIESRNRLAIRKYLGANFLKRETDITALLRLGHIFGHARSPIIRVHLEDNLQDSVNADTASRRPALEWPPLHPR